LDNISSIGSNQDNRFQPAPQSFVPVADEFCKRDQKKINREISIHAIFITKIIASPVFGPLQRRQRYELMPALKACRTRIKIVLNGNIIMTSVVNMLNE
jgi:hypothetical protein